MHETEFRRATDVLHSAADVRRWRMLTASRVFVLAVALGLTVPSGDLAQEAPLFLALCVLAAVMSVPMPGSAVRIAAPFGEAALSTFILVPHSEAVSPLLIYLVIPPLVAGLQAGFKAAAVTAAVEPLVAVASLAGSGGMAEVAGAMQRLAPWMLVGLGLGLLSSWMHLSAVAPGGEQAGYESAHRLLGQLRSVSRRLSSGLDTSAVAESLLVHTAEVLRANRSVALVLGEDTGLSTLAGHGEPFRESLEHDPSVEECWRTQRPQVCQVSDGESTRVRTVIPLRVGSRLIGVVVADAAATVDKVTLSRLRAYLDEHSLRLEAALLFDEVRSTATLEERSRLAREIHDGIAQEIASLGYLVDDLTAHAPGLDAQRAGHELRRELTRVVSELRHSIFDLRSNIHPHAGLGLALSDYAREVGRRSGMTVHLALLEQQQRLHINVETELLRIAQEAITNARKHAAASNLWITLNTESPIIMLRVEDDGVGSVRPRPGHYGLRMMHERAERIGGELTIKPRPRGGTSVSVAVLPHTTSPTGEPSADLSSAS